jgi:hypothetical protein
MSIEITNIVIKPEEIRSEWSIDKKNKKKRNEDFIALLLIKPWNGIQYEILKHKK